MLLTASTMQSSRHQQGVPQRMLITLLPLDQQLSVSLLSTYHLVRDARGIS